MTSTTTRYIILTHRKPENGEGGVDGYEELRFMLGAVGDGSIRSVESRGDALGALIEVRAQTAADAQAFADTLPGVKAGIEKALVIPLSDYAPFRAFADALM